MQGIPDSKYSGLDTHSEKVTIKLHFNVLYFATIRSLPLQDNFFSIQRVIGG